MYGPVWGRSLLGTLLGTFGISLRFGGDFGIVWLFALFVACLVFDALPDCLGPRSRASQNLG